MVGWTMKRLAVIGRGSDGNGVCNVGSGYVSLGFG